MEIIYRCYLSDEVDCDNRGYISTKKNLCSNKVHAKATTTKKQNIQKILRTRMKKNEYIGAG